MSLVAHVPKPQNWARFLVGLTMSDQANESLDEFSKKCKPRDGVIGVSGEVNSTRSSIVEKLVFTNPLGSTMTMTDTDVCRTNHAPPVHNGLMLAKAPTTNTNISHGQITIVGSTEYLVWRTANLCRQCHTYCG